MDTDGGEFLLTSPSYRIEKARLRYENLLLSLDDDSVDDAERHINIDYNTEDNFLENNCQEGSYNSFHTSQLESKQNRDNISYSQQPSVAPITGIQIGHLNQLILLLSPFLLIFDLFVLVPGRVSDILYTLM